MMDLSINERDFLHAALVEGRRMDARSHRDIRPLKISFTPDYGVADISLGKTRVLAAVKAEAIPPFADRPNEGMIEFICDFSNSIAFARAEHSHSTEQDQLQVLLNTTLENTLRKSRAVDTEGLCILAGKLIWSLTVTVSILADDGNLMDAVSIAAVASLLHFRRPDVTVVGGGDQVTIHSLEERHPVPLSIHHVPLCVTFAFYGADSNTYVIDPTAGEEAVQLGSITVCMNSQREICNLSKAGGIPLEMDTISHCAEVAFVHIQSLSTQIKDAVNADLKLREPKSSMKKRKVL